MYVMNWFFSPLYIHYVFAVSLFYSCIYVLFIVLCNHYCVDTCRHSTVDVCSYEYFKPSAKQISNIWMEICVYSLIQIHLHVSRETLRVGFGSIHTPE